MTHEEQDAKLQAFIESLCDAGMMIESTVIIHTRTFDQSIMVRDKLTAIDSTIKSTISNTAGMYSVKFTQSA